MPLRLRPQDTGFFDLFAGSATLLLEATQLLAAVLGAADDAERAAIGVQMSELEIRADENTHEIISRVHGSFFTPFDREDIHALAVAMDACVDHIDAAVDLVLLYDVRVFPPLVAEQVEVLTRMAELTVEAMPRVRSARTLSGYWVAVNRLENRANKTYRRLVAELVNEAGADPIVVLKTKEVADEVEAAADAVERVARKIEGIAVKEF